MRTKLVIGGAILATSLIAACGTTGGSSEAPASDAVATAPAWTQSSSGAAASAEATAAPAAAVAKAGQTSLGTTLVDAQGRTLYGFLKDGAGMSTCVNACAQAWPPVVITGDQLPAGLDARVFSVISRSDGTHQLKAGKWPLYRFSGDAAAGDVNGQGSANSWFVVKPDGTLNKGMS